MKYISCLNALSIRVVDFSLLKEIVHYLPLQSETDHRDMFINIMTSKNQMILNALGKFVYEEFKRREIEPLSAKR